MNEMKKFFIRTYGCQMNKHDTEILTGILLKKGYTQVSDANQADIILYNTCAIRQRAEEKVYGNIGSLKPLKDKNPDIIFGLIGCMAQKHEEEIFKRIPYLDIVAGPQSVFKITDMIESVYENRKSSDKNKMADFTDYGYIPQGQEIDRKSSMSAWVSIMKGCDNFCTYCIVPYVRGREKSRPASEIIEEIKFLVKKGFYEVTLLGQNVLAYGKSLEEKMDFPDLIEEIQKIEGLERIRYQTGHPRDYTDKLLEAFSRSPKVCRHFHLPLQAGSTKVLKAMNRGHSKEFFLELIAKIRRMFPFASITTDIIVGFPGEGEEEFQETLEVVRKARFDGAHTFFFSPREGTRAWGMEPLLSEKERKQRLARLNEVQDKICLEENLKYIGRKVTVLSEGLDAKFGKLITGRTDTNKIALTEPDDELKNRPMGALFEAEVYEATPWTLKCRLIKILRKGEANG
jgi:tRNA-2-methylthio-N6-dimethylallyladenosine synthase